MANLTPPQTTASKLRALLAKENEIVVCPGVYDGFTARLALNAGFKILYMVSILFIFLWFLKEYQVTDEDKDWCRHYNVPSRHG
jgi:hypothetical protein